MTDETRKYIEKAEHALEVAEGLIKNDYGTTLSKPAGLIRAFTGC